jgi:hypothetical protein
LRIEKHRTAEVQDQQARIATLLVANGLLFAFLASRVPTSGALHWEDRVELASAAVLAVALLLGLGALLTRVPISSPSFLDPEWFGSTAQNSDENETLRLLSSDLGTSLTTSNFAAVLTTRRHYMQGQLVCIGIGAALFALSSAANALRG